MFKALMLVVGMMLVSTASYAQVWQQVNVNAQIGANNLNVFASVQNVYSNSAILCRGQVFGLTYSGMWLNSWMNNQVIYPGQYRTVYVYTNAYNPFVDARASIECLF